MTHAESVFVNSVYTRKNQDFVRNVIRRLLVRSEVFERFEQEIDEIVQWTFVDAWQGLSRFRGESDIQTWLYKIAQNRALAVLRKDSESFRGLSRRNGILPGWLICNLRVYPSPYRSLLCLEARRRVRKVLRRFSKRQTQILRMRFKEGMRFAEIAEAVGSTEGTMKITVARVLPFIRAELTKIGVTP